MTHLSCPEDFFLLAARRSERVDLCHAWPMCIRELRAIYLDREDRETDSLEISASVALRRSASTCTQ